MDLSGGKLYRITKQGPFAKIPLNHIVSRETPRFQWRGGNRLAASDHRNPSVLVNQIIKRVQSFTTIRPVERSTHRGHAEPTERGRKIFGAAAKPFDVGNSGAFRSQTALGEHLRLRIHCDHLLEQMRERNRQGTWATSKIQKPSPTIQIQIVP
jgi:hypothetical protein